ncbi:Sulfotransferase family protein [Pseudogemmobacter humi]|uniref:Sulfotransferase family protein n=1 Tax=Pseudogemmobacter humi TaxID=2483812 RepID=A0A3P5XEG8_9RHOB|nr:Sulfotransferase family protein [Pseudogemmobacter humi]
MAISVPSDISFFVSVHIPKTAGTTLGTILNRCCKYRLLMDYPGYDGNEYFTADPLIAKNRDFIAGYYKGIHGHFNVCRHQSVFPEAKFVAMLRHPVDRLISQYMHELNDPTDSMWHKYLTSGERTIVDMAEHRVLRRAMAQHLEGRPIEDYDLLMLSENMGMSLMLLQHTIGNLHIGTHFGEPPQIPRENMGNKRQRSVVIDDKTKSAIYDRLTEDIELYKKASELFTKKARKYL